MASINLNHCQNQIHSNSNRYLKRFKKRRENFIRKENLRRKGHHNIYMVYSSTAYPTLWEGQGGGKGLVSPASMTCVSLLIIIM